MALSQSAPRTMPDSQPGDLQQLLYVSAARPGLSQAEVDAILASARSHNAAQGITGLLLCIDESFLQVLEGPEAKVQELFARIGRDPRHSQVLCLLNQPALRRDFPDWSMGYDRLRETAQNGSLFRLTRNALDSALPPKAGPAILALIRTFLKVNAA